MEKRKGIYVASSIIRKRRHGPDGLVNADVYSVAKHTGSYSVYRDLQSALSRKDRKAVAELLEKGKAFKLLRVAKVAGGGLSVVFVAQAGFAGLSKEVLLERWKVWEGRLPIKDEMVTQ